MHKDYLIWKKHKVQIQRQKFYRQFALYVEPNGNLRLKTAVLSRKKDMLKFLAANEKWVEKKLQDISDWKQKFPPIRYQWGEELVLLGYRIVLTPWPNKKSELRGAKLFICDAAKDKKHAVTQFYRKFAQSFLTKRLQYWANQTGLRPSSVKIRSYKARWGACSSKKEISLNWKLVAAPERIIDYVIIHELSHLRHMNHAKSFWNLVSLFDPNYKKHKKWLKNNNFYFDFLEKKSELYS